MGKATPNKCKTIKTTLKSRTKVCMNWNARHIFFSPLSPLMLIKLLNVLSCPLLEPGGTDSHLISKPYSKPALIAEKAVGITTGKECLSKSQWTGKVCSCHHNDWREASQHLLEDSDTWPDRGRLHTPQHVNWREGLWN